ncbi:MAG: hypothetical protein WDN28_23420 [Chthoniobacter sp.]
MQNQQKWESEQKEETNPQENQSKKDTKKGEALKSTIRQNRLGKR